jgi:hypothetical protein
MTVAATLVEFTAALAARRTPAITLTDGAASVALAEACYRAIARRSGHIEGGDASSVLAQKKRRRRRAPRS